MQYPLHSFSLLSLQESFLCPTPPPSGSPSGGAIGTILLASRIFIVDDERMNVVLLKAILERAGYTSIVTTTNSLEVTTLCAQEAPDLVLLDLMMPRRDGFGILEDLKDLREQNRLPVLMLTADTNPETRSRALASGASAFLTKPFTAAQVLPLVQRLLAATLSKCEM